MDFNGEFETHLTVSTEPSTEMLRAWTESRNIKFSHILLDAGKTPSQPMLTLQSMGTLGEARTIAHALAADLAAAGFAVLRTKIEASPHNKGIPRTTQGIEQIPPFAHFEHHVKVLLSRDADVTALRAFAGDYGGYLSLNARRTRDGGTHERFITQRCYGIPMPEARRRLARLLRALRTQPLRLLEVEQEYVVYDSNVSLDRGWMPEVNP